MKYNNSPRHGWRFLRSYKDLAAFTVSHYMMSVQVVQMPRIAVSSCQKPWYMRPMLYVTVLTLLSPSRKNPNSLIKWLKYRACYSWNYMTYGPVKEKNRKIENWTYEFDNIQGLTKLITVLWTLRGQCVRNNIVRREQTALHYWFIVMLSF